MLYDGSGQAGGVYDWYVGAFTTYVCLQNALKDFSLTVWQKFSNILSYQ